MEHIPYLNELEQTRRLFNHHNLDAQYLIDFCLEHFDHFLKSSCPTTFDVLEQVLILTNKSYEYHDFKDALLYAFEDALNVSPITMKY